jgi:hypothetical protein
VVGSLLHAHLLSRKDLTQIDLAPLITDAATACHDRGPVVKRIVQCHTAPPYAAGGDPFKGEPEQINTEGYLAGGTPFGPGITSRNLTPRANGRPANLTWEQFLEVMRKGTDFKNRHPEISPLLQVMPWPVYGKMNTLDLLI